MLKSRQRKIFFVNFKFGIGSQGKMIRGSYWTAASHTDGVVSKPTIIVDGVTIEENGKYVDPELAEICNAFFINLLFLYSIFEANFQLYLRFSPFDGTENATPPAPSTSVLIFNTNLSALLSFPVR